LIYIIIPCFNEADRLPTKVFIDYHLAHADVRYCFVDDGSTDKTKLIISKLADNYSAGLEILILPKNQGKAAAIRAGMLHIADRDCTHIGFLDADLATPLDAIADFRTILTAQPGLELLMGSRMKRLGNHIERNEFRHYVGRIIATCISQVLHLEVYDSQCGAKFFRRDVVRGLFTEPFLSRWLFDVEILARLIRQHGRNNLVGRVAEMPLKTWLEKGGSKVKLSYFFKLWYELYRIHRVYQ
jgi:dolichyl-phosphate beta-glucosyltransferase